MNWCPGPKSQLQILINCAAECPETQILKKRLRKTEASKMSEELVDSQFSSNVLAYHYMIKEFFEDLTIAIHWI